ncbi:glycine zipper 2TM domain-containing protein [Rhodobacter sp. SGA-6-6]|uniref:YMGG-like glycine zipper-containing protein n=1 Tax=Rhodobacter sp. SGA-6-6 TaxID=2710882 RepID=UPI0013EA82FD|nr:YMGG-like glycine zipper-containing protein [Rhodobacter sp. SGA-6-6]NGM45346.1 glycine zipper 2TM domain-containing protein [Rhodobacter sp. SGA-6-6]
MKIHLFMPIAALALAACVASPEQNTAVGALSGAAIGAAVSGGDDKVQGALTGAAVGAIAGTMIGQTNQPGKCYYRDANGNRFIANC